MNAMRVGGIVLAAISAFPVFILLRMFGNVRRELRRHDGLRVKGFLIVAGWTLALIAGVLLIVFS